jgi:hypothetical protein
MSDVTSNKTANPGKQAVAAGPLVRFTPAEAKSNKARRDARRVAIKQQNANSKM